MRRPGYLSGLGDAWFMRNEAPAVEMDEEETASALTTSSGSAHASGYMYAKTPLQYKLLQQLREAEIQKIIKMATG